jgi:nicotinate-nucleotide adenylyltransferase
MILRAGLPFALAGMSVGLLGGSFDPAHEGHLHITEMALRRFRLDRVWWLVTPGNPLKAHGPAPLAERIAQARRMVHDPHVEITDIEARLGTRMTRDTLAALQRLYPRVRFVWLMGADNMVQFDRWDSWREIAARVPIGVIARPGWRMPARFSRAARMLWRDRQPEAQAGQLAAMVPPAWVMINVPLNKQSSSAIRAKQKRAKP